MILAQKQNGLISFSLPCVPRPGWHVLAGSCLSAGPKKPDEHKDKEIPAAEKPNPDKSQRLTTILACRLLEENGDFSKAIDEYKKAIQHDPQSPDIYIELANAYLRHRRVRDAVRGRE
jgi:Tfp pilus assembly protein PilF